MSRHLIPFTVGDTSALARSLRAQLAGREAQPSHVELLNILARAAGFRNFQHFRASHEAEGRLQSDRPAPAPIDHTRIERMLRCFDPQSRLVRWPARRSDQDGCLWVLWSGFAAGQSFTERQINASLRERHLFGDHALLRRALIGHGLMTRKPDGSDYRRVEHKPPAEALTLIRALASRRPARTLAIRN
ncbi:hypothetical protein DB459_05110 [Bradyrhizobium sp. WD16]|nr:DUF2087 domain-containing protein [Bradyrhizobium sp. WD16]UTD26391.1 hypothetical protein DB459_05110 [Bradyrhizobium sp. WD16]